MIKIIKLEELGITVSLDNNLKASANACKEPYKPTAFGPRRRCIAPKSLRSNTVKNATARINGKNDNRKCNQSKSRTQTINTTLSFIINKTLEKTKLLKYLISNIKGIFITILI